jgi:DNA repair exonuclease SbcCD nuclease subunit
MKIIELSDLHLVIENPIGRIDDITDVQWEKLEFVFEYAKDNGIEYILQAGDFTDIRRSWELLQKLSAFLARYPMIKILVVLGQHDSYYHDMTNQKTIVGVLTSSGLLTRLTDEPIQIDDNVFVYGSSYGEEVPVPVKNKRNTVSILVIHRQILVSKIYAQQTEYEMAQTFLKEHMDYDLILCGDAHQRFEKKIGSNIICNTGPMLRLEATPSMMSHEPGFFVYDTGSKKAVWKEIPAVDGKSVLSREHIQKKKDREENFASFIAKVQNSTESNDSISFEKNLDAIIKANKTSRDVKAVINHYLFEREEVR